MNYLEQSSNSGRRRSVWIAGITALLLTAALLAATGASAAYEQVATFAQTTEPGFVTGSSLINSAGIAVNERGAGGVPPGSVYAVADERVIRFTSSGEFREAWGVGVANRSEKFERCGPDGEAAFPVCGETGADQNANSVRGSITQPIGLAVDQATGNVYVLTAKSQSLGQTDELVTVYSGNGEVISAFGERGPARPFPEKKESIAEGPEKFHISRGIAVDESGTVYVSDLGYAEASEPGGQQSRVMVFKPHTPGNYEQYEYEGRVNDIASSHGIGSVNFQPGKLALDTDGDLFTANAEEIYEFAPGEPNVPSCEVRVSGGGVNGFTVNPATDEPFYFTGKDKKIHQLSACSGKGKFEQVAAVAVEPKTETVNALAVNPTLVYGALRPAGVLYLADGDEHGGSPESKGSGDIFAPAIVRSPLVQSESVSSVGTSSATLIAQINPNGSQTQFVFQYITDEAYRENGSANRFAGSLEAPLGGGALGIGNQPLAARAAISGLQPDTEYHFRVVASSHCNPADAAEICEAAGSEEKFRTYPVELPGLPDHRAYELVSPSQKDGGEVIPDSPSFASCGYECKPGKELTRFPVQASTSGNAVVYQGFPFSFAAGAPVFNSYLSTRAPSGWTTTTLSPGLQGEGEAQGPRMFDGELTRDVFYQQQPPTLSGAAPAEYPNLYFQNSGDPGSFAPLLTQGPPNRSPSEYRLTYAGASADFGRQFFAANDALTGEVPGVAPAAPDPGLNSRNLYESTGVSVRLVNVLPGNSTSVPGAVFGSGTQIVASAGESEDLSHAISEDGSRVFWSSPSGQVYVRENGELTEEIPDHVGKFLTASEDGSRVLLSDGELFNVDNLSGSPVDLTQGKGGFKGITGQSNDLSTIYFVDTAILDETPNVWGAVSSKGADNLYAWRAGAVSFVTALAATDSEDWAPAPGSRTAEASADGHWLAFLSQEELTGYDNVGPSCVLNSNDVFESGRCSEAFIYDSASGLLTCASCNPSGQRPAAGTRLPLISEVRGYMPQARYLSNSGRLIFDSGDSLSPFDRNGTVEDVYEFEPAGVGSCDHQPSCLSLISTGNAENDSNFLAADPDGRNIFFTTRAQLSARDRDGLIDVYDAREGGGIATESETVAGECQGEACQPIPVAPSDPTPSSANFEGAGNVHEKPSKSHKRHKKQREKLHKKHHKERRKKAAKKRGRHTKTRPSDRAIRHNRGGPK